MSSAFTPSVVSIATVPTSMDDATATRLGLKSYSHGTNYFNGIAPNITLVSGGGTLNSVSYVRYIPRQMQDGTWRVIIGADVTLSSQVRTGLDFAFVGIVFNSAGYQSAVGGAYDQAVMLGNQANPGVNTISLKSQSTTTTGYWLTGDFLLASKPTWAY